METVELPDPPLDPEVPRFFVLAGSDLASLLVSLLASDLASPLASRLAGLPCRIVFTCVAD